MLDTLKELLGKLLPGMDMACVTPQTRLREDLGLDSLALLMLSMELEDHFGFRFTEPMVFATAGDVCEFLENR